MDSFLYHLTEVKLTNQLFIIYKMLTCIIYPSVLLDMNAFGKIKRLQYNRNDAYSTTSTILTNQRNNQ